MQRTALSGMSLGFLLLCGGVLLASEGDELRERAKEMRREAATRRIRHLRVAAENLKRADAHDLARQITDKAESLEREVQAAKKRLAQEIQQVHGGEDGPDVVRELKQELERLRGELKELQQKVEKR